MFSPFSRLAVAGVMLLALGACGGPESTEPEASVGGGASIALGNQGRASLVAGGNTSVAVSVDRGAGFSGALTVVATNLPTGVTASPLTISGSQSSGSLILTAAATAPRTPIAASVNIQGTGSGVTTGTVYLTLSVTAP